MHAQKCSQDLSMKQELAPKKKVPGAYIQTCRNPSCSLPDVQEDADGASVVCIQCGMIQTTSVFETASTGAIFHEGVSRTVVHRYSRLVILRGILRSLQAETRVDLSFDQTCALHSCFPSGEPPASTFRVKKAILRLKLPYRLMKHATTIRFLLWRCATPNPSEDEIRIVLRRFRVLENAWDRLPLGSSIRQGRKKFLSYPLVWKHLCVEEGFPELGSIMDELQIKNKRNVKRQLNLLVRLIEFSKQ